MDDIQVWNFPLNDSQINNYMNCSPTGNEDGLIGYWNFESGVFNEAQDIASDNNGVIQGGEYSTDVPPQTCFQNNDEEEESSQNNQIIIGDVNCDSLVNEVDAQAILEYTYTNGATPLPCDTILDCSCNESLGGLNTTQLQNMVNVITEEVNNNNYTGNSGAGCDFIFPDGLMGEPFFISLNGFETYSPENGKRLYVFRSANGAATINTIYMDTPNDLPYILNSDDELGVFGQTQTVNFYGFLVDENPNVQALTMELNESETYSPEIGKNLYVLKCANSTPSINNEFINSPTSIPMILSNNHALGGFNGEISFNGYLVDEDYFSDCSGGGGSTINSSSETNNNYMLLNQTQYDLTIDYNGNLNIGLQINDTEVLQSYLFKSLTCNIYDDNQSLINSIGIFNHPSSYTNWNFGSTILDEYSNQSVTIHITFMSSLGMIVIDENILIPE